MADKLMYKNKRGAIGIILFFAVIMGVLVLGFIGTLVWSVIDIASDEITPIMKDLGMVGDTNLSQASTYTFGVLDGFIQSMPWIIALAYILALIFTLVFIFVVDYNPHPAFIAFYLSLMILLVFGCVVMSNMYQDIYTGNDEISTRLQEQTVMSYLILHSPYIMAFISLVGGVLMFAMRNTADAGYGGGI